MHYGVYVLCQILQTNLSNLIQAIEAESFKNTTGFDPTKLSISLLSYFCW
jgi:hypothetical protein